MIAIHADIPKLKALELHLALLPGDIEKYLHPMIAEMTIAIEPEVVRRTPADTGSLQRSVMHKTVGRGVTVVGKVFSSVQSLGTSYYSFAVEEGRSPNKPMPPMSAKDGGYSSFVKWVYRHITPGARVQGKRKKTTRLATVADRWKIARRLAWPIARKIADEGILPGHHMFRDGLQAATPQLREIAIKYRRRMIEEHRVR